MKIAYGFLVCLVSVHVVIAGQTPQALGSEYSAIQKVLPPGDVADIFKNTFSWVAGEGAFPKTFSRQAQLAEQIIVDELIDTDLEPVLAFINKVRRYERRRRYAGYIKAGGLAVGGSLAVAAAAVAITHAKKHRGKSRENDSVWHSRLYGNKVMNLRRLQGLTSQWSDVERRFGYAVKVPEFIALSSNAVRNFVEKILRVALTDSRFEGAALDRPSLAIRIKNAMSSFSLNDRTAQDLFGDEGKKLADFLIQPAVDRGSLMVRSTGREDSEECSNAGGNTSVASVAPNLEAVVQAVGTVIASYFDDKSLQQRVAAGHRVKANDYFMPVLIQIMVGEINDTEIPVSGVMFTQDPESGAANAWPTSGLTIIQSAWGHNEYVVASEGPVDTYIMGSDGYAFTTIRHKKMRRKPYGNQLALVPNGIKAAQVSLDKDQLRVLKLCAIILESEYKRSMDVEFVFKDRTLYLVQARPFENSSVSARESSYVDVSNVMVKDRPRLYGTVVGNSGGYVRTIDNASQCILAGTALEALDKYHALTVTERKAIQAIITSEIVATTSHPATQFRAYQKPIICMQDKYADACVMLKKSCLIDFQQAFIMEKGDGHELASYIQEGYVSYPAAKVASVPVVEATDAERLKQFIQAIDKQITITADDVRQVLTQAGTQLIRELRASCFHLRQGNQVDEHIKKIWILCTRHPAFKRYPDRYKNCVVFLGRCIKMLIAAKVFSQNKTDLNYRTRWLYGVHFLETILFQQIEMGDCLEQDSFVMLSRDRGKAMRAGRELNNEEGVVSAAAGAGAGAVSTAHLHSSTGTFELYDVRVSLSMMSDYLFRDDLKSAWIRFVKDNFAAEMEESGERQTFVQSMRLLSTLGITSQWLNSSFAHACSVEGSSEKRIPELAALTAELTAAQPLLQKFHDIKKEIQAISLPLFANPKTFIKAWEAFQAGLIKYFISPEFIDSFCAAFGIAKVACLQAMYDFVTIFDTAIKQVTGSNLFKVNSSRAIAKEGVASIKDILTDPSACLQQMEFGDKIFTFNKMLIEYQGVLFAWLIPLRDKSLLHKLLPYWGKDILSSISELQKITQERLVKEINLASHDELKVGRKAVMFLGSGGTVTIGAHYHSISYEALFIALHKSFLTLIATQGSDVFLITQVLDDMQMFDNSITGLKIDFYGPKFPVRLGIEFDDTCMRIKYSYPLRQHNALITVQKNMKGTCRVIVDINALNEPVFVKRGGENFAFTHEVGRFELLDFIVSNHASVCATFGWELASMEHSDVNGRFAWETQAISSQSISFLVDFINSLVKWTMPCFFDWKLFALYTKYLPLDSRGTVSKYVEGVRLLRAKCFDNADKLIQPLLYGGSKELEELVEWLKHNSEYCKFILNPSQSVFSTTDLSKVREKIFELAVRLIELQIPFETSDLEILTDAQRDELRNKKRLMRNGV